MLEVFAAFLTALETGEPFPVYDWADPVLAKADKPNRYLAVSDFTPSRNNVRLSTFRGVAGHMFAVTVVAETADEVRAACDRMYARLNEQVLTAGAATTTPLHQDESNTQPVTPMRDTTNPRLFTAVEIWRCAL